MAFDARKVLSNGLDPAMVADSETLNFGGSEIIRPLKLNCSSAFILEKSGFGRCPTINLRWLAVVAVVSKAPLGSAMVRITKAKNEKARIVRVSGCFRCGKFHVIFRRLEIDGINCTKGIHEGVAVKRKTRMRIPTR